VQGFGCPKENKLSGGRNEERPAPETVKFDVAARYNGTGCGLVILDIFFDCRWITYLRIRARSEPGLIPSSTAAPFSPSIRQPDFLLNLATKWLTGSGIPSLSMA